MRHVRTDLDFHGFVSGPTSAQHDQLRPRQRNLGPSCAPLVAALHQVGSNPSQFCRLDVTSFPLFPTFFGFEEGSFEAMLPTLGWSRAQLLCQMRPDRTKLRMLNPKVHKSHHVGPQLGSSWANWPEFGASYAQVGPKWSPARPNLRPRTAKFNPSPSFWLGPVGPLFSSPSYSLGAGGSRREATRICGGCPLLSNFQWVTIHELYIYIAIEKPYPFPKLLDIAGASKLKKTSQTGDIPILWLRNWLNDESHGMERGYLKSPINFQA